MPNAWKILLLALALALLPIRARKALARESLDAQLRPYLASHGLPALAAAVAKDGVIVAAGAVGTRRAGTDAPVTLDDRFHIGSDTKAMTAFVAATLVEQGRLRWDSTPAQVFPEFAPDMDPGFASITLEQLLSNTSGIPSDNEDTQAVLRNALLQEGNLDALRLHAVREWSRKPLVSPPGKAFHYSNMGFVVAGSMMERASGKTWDELIVGSLFTPLGMTTAGLGCQSSLGKVDAPLGHVSVDGGVQAVLAGPNGDNPAIIGPAGIAHMSILDFARWGAWNAGEGKRGPALVSAKTMRRLHAPVFTLPPEADGASGGKGLRRSYGLGWGVSRTAYASHPVLSHAGSNTMNLAQICVDPKKDLAVVLTTNIAGPRAEEALKALMQELYARYAASPAN